MIPIPPTCDFYLSLVLLEKHTSFQKWWRTMNSQQDSHLSPTSRGEHHLLLHLHAVWQARSEWGLRSEQVRWREEFSTTCLNFVLPWGLNFPLQQARWSQLQLTNLRRESESCLSIIVVAEYAEWRLVGYNLLIYKRTFQVKKMNDNEITRLWGS